MNQNMKVINVMTPIQTDFSEIPFSLKNVCIPPLLTNKGFFMFVNKFIFKF